MKPPEMFIFNHAVATVMKPRSEIAKAPIRELMSSEPVTIAPGMKLDEAARVMKDKNIGSLVVIDDNGKPVGIITERDIITKVVALNLVPQEILAKDIMNSPVITAHPDMDLMTASREMSSKNIRRLPVVLNSVLIGIVTENDLFRFSPSFTEIAEEFASINSPVDGVESESAAGYCENCKVYSNSLDVVNGQLVCGECFDKLS